MASFALIDVSSQIIGEPEPGVWCAVCQQPSALKVDMALLVAPPGHDLTTFDPVVRLVRMISCPDCGTIFESPERPELVDNRDR